MAAAKKVDDGQTAAATFSFHMSIPRRKRKAGKKTVIRSRPPEIPQSSTENLFLQVDGLLW